MQQPDQLAGGNERDDEDHAGCPHGRQAGGVEDEISDVDRAVGALAVAEDRVVLGDLERRPGMYGGGRVGERGCRGAPTQAGQPRAAGVLVGKRVWSAHDADVGEVAGGIGLGVVRQQGLGHQDPTLKLQLVNLEVAGSEGDQRRTGGGTSAQIGSIKFLPGWVRGLSVGSSTTTLTAERSESVTVIARFRITVTVTR